MALINSLDDLIDASRNSFPSDPYCLGKSAGCKALYIQGFHQDGSFTKVGAETRGFPIVPQKLRGYSLSGARKVVGEDFHFKLPFNQKTYAYCLVVSSAKRLGLFDVVVRLV